MAQTKKPLQIVLDSFTGYSEKKLTSLGFTFVPQLISIDEHTYQDGRDITLKQVVEKIKNAKKIHTSQVPQGLLEETFAELSKKFAHVIYIPINSGVSSTYQSAVQVSQKFPNVHIANVRLVGTALVDTASRAIDDYEKNRDIKKTLTLIESISHASHCYFAPKNLEGFIRGGRLKGTKKFILQKTGLIPRLVLRDEGIKVNGVKRSLAKNVFSSVEKIIHAIGQAQVHDYYWEIVHTFDQDTIKIARQALEAIGVIKPIETPVPAIVAAHTGIGAIGINVWPKPTNGRRG
ncbi:DegV family protein [Mycoplasma sp. ATU-Cv-703]|uniref:DegV family protein n=1 Tax=Mycoplasma sp. ATU-Cv-703 TaxID=2498595 RepID=UPI000FDF5BA6